MDRSEQLTMHEQDSGQSFIGEMSQFYPISVAFWFKYWDEDRWHLNVTIPPTTRDEFDEVVGLVRQLAAKPKNRFVDPFQMTFLDLEQPLVRRAIELMDDDLITTSTSRLPTNQGASIDGVVIYPKRDMVPKSPVVAASD